MSGGGSSSMIAKGAKGLGSSTLNVLSAGTYRQVTGKGSQQSLEGWGKDLGRDFLNMSTVGVATPYMESRAKEPTPDAAPTMEDVAAREPDKEKRRRQRMAALMAQGRQGTILTGPSGITPSNTIGGGGKQLAGA